MKTMLWIMLFLLPAVAHAQQSHSFTIRNGKLVGDAPATLGAAQTAKSTGINQEQQQMFSALSAMMRRDYAKAEELYSGIIQHDNGNAEAWLQRGVARREMKNTEAAKQDAKQALLLLNGQLQQEPRNAKTYQKRSMALRLLGEFDHAKKDLLTAMQLEGKSGLAYRNDLQAIELERKIAASAN